MLNPFRYGKPVPPERFVGRKDVLRTIFARIHNGESTAVVGEPHIGKTSFLRYIRDEKVRSAWLGDTAKQFAFTDIDCHMLPSSYRPGDFWAEVLDRVGEVFEDATILGQIEVVRRSSYGSFSLKRLFDLLGRGGMRAILLVDEFDVLLNHANFNTAEFFGALRSLAVQTDGLALLTASRMPVGEMNRRSQEINPFGSPFFNNLIEARLLPLRPTEVDLLIEQSLAGTGVDFAPDDRAYIAHVTGRHPFLVQIAAAALFDALIQGKVGAERYAEVDRLVHSWAAAHFEDTWRHLAEAARRAILLVAVAELFPQDHDRVDLGPLEQYDPDMRWLTEGGLIEQTDDPQCVNWHGRRWRVSARSFARWMVDNCKWEELEHPAGGALNAQYDGAERIVALRDQINEHQRRLDKLEIKHAQYGNATDASILTEIEDIEHKIADLKGQISRLRR